jgi:hypothetical protein
MTRCTDSIYCTGHVPCEGCLVCPGDSTPVPDEIRRMVLAAVTAPKPHLRVENGMWQIVNWQEWNRSMQPDRFCRAFYWVRERNFKVRL